MLAGKVPFEAESAVSVALMQLQNNAKRLTEINPDIPLGLEQICIHAMEKTRRTDTNLPRKCFWMLKK